MEHGMNMSSKLTAISHTLLNSLRRNLTKLHLISLVRTLRLFFHFGPWRVVPKFLIRQLRPVQRSPGDNEISLLPSLDVNAIAKEVRQASVAVAGVLPAEFVNRLRTITDYLPVNHYQLMHHIDEDVRQLVNDPGIKNVLRAYFKCEPVLLESTLVVTGPKQVHGLSEQNAFHFDYGGWESLNVLVYLSDVTIHSSYHAVIKGSHRNIGVRNILKGTLTTEEAQKMFGSAIQIITGPAGTLFFENTEAFHRRHASEEPRIILNLLYASHRNWLSHGRTNPNHIERRTRAYNQLRNQGQ